jgi:PAS domain S-box-containing protein
MSSSRLGRLLIVDDEVELLTTLCNILSERGYETVGCTSGRDALEMLREQDFDLLLADLMMPDTDGIALVRASLEIDPQLVGIIMTGQGTVQTAVEAMKTGALDYIPKPFKLQALLPVLSRAMDVRRLRMENLQLRETVAIYELSNTIAFTPDVNTILQKTIDAAMQQCDADEASIMLPTHEGDQLYVAVARGEGRASLVGERVPIAQGIAGWVARHRQPLLLHGEVLDPQYVPIRLRPDISSAISLPLLVAGKLLGVLNVSTTRRRRFNVGQVKALTLLANSASSAVEAAQLCEELRRSDEKYRSIFEHAVEGIYQTTPEGRFLTANPAMAHLLGYASSESLLAAIASIDHQLYVQAEHRAEMKQLLEAQDVIQGFETQLYRQDGSMIWVALNVRAVRDAHGVLLHYEGTAEDITERKRTERRLAVQYAVTRILAVALTPAQAIPRILQVVCEQLGWEWSVLWQVDRQDNVLRCAEIWHRPTAQLAEFEVDSWRRTFVAGVGLPGRVWASGQPIWTPDATQDANFPRTPSAAQEGRHGAFAFPILLGNAVLGVIECFSRNMLAPDHDMLQLFTTIGSEIGQLIERKRIEEERERLAKEIRLLLESTGEGIYGLDREGRCTFMNKSAAAMLGGQPNEMLGRNLHALVHHTRPDGSAYPLAECQIYRATQTGQSCSIDTEMFWRQDGTAFPVAYTSYPILEEQALKGAVVTFTDLTERKRVEAELQRQREALYQTEKLSAMGVLLAGVAHELNNPLSVIVGYTELLRNLRLGEPLTERVEKVAQAANRCARIVRSFLALARQHPPERHTVHLNQVVKEAIELLSYPLRVDGVEVHLELADDLPVLWADPNQLHQVVVNLVSNAQHALRDSLPPRRVAMSTYYASAQSQVCFAVADTGPGIPPELQARIFEPFFTTKPSGQGTGLGLPLCRGIIEGHGGTIRVESAPGQGTRFVVELPITAVPVVMPRVRAPEASASLQGRAILVVDDEPEVAGVLAEFLTSDGHQVDTAGNGVEALKKLEECSYDVILTDLRMPELDGPGFYQELERRHPALCRRVIFLTGDALTPKTQALLRQTAVRAVGKPFDFGDIRCVIQQVLQAETGQ